MKYTTHIYHQLNIPLDMLNVHYNMKKGVCLMFGWMASVKLMIFFVQEMLAKVFQGNLTCHC